MDIDSIPESNFSNIELRHLRAFQTLLREHNLTRAAESMGVTQPALSKTLNKLRTYFHDPLFIRVGHRMEPTAKALEMEPFVTDLLERITNLRTEQVPFDPATASRTFSFCVVDAGLIRLLPPLLELIGKQAPGITLNVVPLDLDRLETSLESGRLDFAMGSYPSLSKRIRRQALWSVKYLSSVRQDHPRIRSTPALSAFASEKHVLVSAAGTGHAHAQAEKALEKAVPPQNIVCRVPSFLSAALVASRSDAIVTLPEGVTRIMAAQLGLRVFTPPVRVPRVDVSQYWHERFHRDQGNVWIRTVFSRLFKEK